MSIPHTNVSGISSLMQFKTIGRYYYKSGKSNDITFILNMYT